MGEAKHMLFAKNLICVCIEGSDNGDYQGLIWHQYSDDPVEFGSMMSMLTKIDGLLDEWDFPQKSLEQRAFLKEDKDGMPSGAVDGELVIDKVKKLNGTRNVQNKRGKLGTFVVYVAFRQNATWQGQVICTEKEEQHDFVSAMELTKIMLRTIEGK